jgi:hypothetical protein
MIVLTASNPFNSEQFHMFITLPFSGMGANDHFRSTALGFSYQIQITLVVFAATGLKVSTVPINKTHLRMRNISAGCCDTEQANQFSSYEHITCTSMGPTKLRTCTLHGTTLHLCMFMPSV